MIIRKLKYAYAPGKIPTNDFRASEAFFQVVSRAHNLLKWFKCLRVPLHLQRATLQRFRRRLFVVPAQLVRPGGFRTLRLATSYPLATALSRSAAACPATSTTFLNFLEDRISGNLNELIAPQESSFSTQHSG